ncbi:MAG: phosphopantetheine adenylyltransferase [Halioglobus sp.]|nr:phosphopantetheine adenylyltransferase [Halioglobus sp.]|tara:strand:- start:6309 stop:6686 length:378 start_codon:yes stop_codon:yes gene_type:complete
MGKMITFCLLVVGLVNFAPVLGAISAQRLESAYSITLAGNDLAILMRHRALLFGILGAFILYSAFSPLYQWAAMIMGGVSMVGFAMLVFSTGGYNAALGKVLFMDVVGIVFLLAAAALKYVSESG